MMKFVRYAAAAATALMSLMKLPGVLDAAQGDISVPVPLAALISVFGVIGLVTVVAMLRRTAWALPAAVAIGVVNTIAAVIALAKSTEGAGIGLTVSLVGLVLSALATREATKTPVPQPL